MPPTNDDVPGGPTDPDLIAAVCEIFILTLAKRPGLTLAEVRDAVAKAQALLDGRGEA